VVLTATDTGEN